MSKHTAGQLQVLIADSETMKGANCVLISENGDQIARCSAPFPFDTSWDERDANAHRLARAWNCHDELLEALRRCEDALDSLFDQMPGLEALQAGCTTLGNTRTHALAAIAKATT